MSLNLEFVSGTVFAGQSELWITGQLFRYFLRLSPHGVRSVEKEERKVGWPKGDSDAAHRVLGVHTRVGDTVGTQAKRGAASAGKKLPQAAPHPLTAFVAAIKWVAPLTGAPRKLSKRIPSQPPAVLGSGTCLPPSGSIHPLAQPAPPPRNGSHRPTTLPQGTITCTSGRRSWACATSSGACSTTRRAASCFVLCLSPSLTLGSRRCARASSTAHAVGPCGSERGPEARRSVGCRGHAGEGHGGGALPGGADQGRGSGPGACGPSAERRPCSAHLQLAPIASIGAKESAPTKEAANAVTWAAAVLFCVYALICRVFYRVRTHPGGGVRPVVRRSHPAVAVKLPHRLPELRDGQGCVRPADGAPRRCRRAIHSALLRPGQRGLVLGQRGRLGSGDGGAEGLAGDAGWCDGRVALPLAVSPPAAVIAQSSWTLVVQMACAAFSDGAARRLLLAAQIFVHPSFRYRTSERRRRGCRRHRQRRGGDNRIIGGTQSEK